MQPILHCLLIVALLGGSLQPARAAAFPTRQAPQAAGTQEEAPSPYQLKLALELDDVQAKTGQARLSWEVANWEADAGLSLTLALPEGLAPARPGTLQRGEAAGWWAVPLRYAQGSLELRLEEGTRLPLEARGELRQKDALVDSYLAILEGAPTADSLPRVGTGGRKVSGLEGKVTVVFPKGALAEEAGIQIQRVPQQAGTLGNGQAFEILAAGLVSQKAIHQFGQSILIQMAYEPELVQGNEQSLSLTYFSEEEQDWIVLPGWVDSEQHILYARSNHLSIFNYTIHSMDLARLPSLKGYETSLFSGAATYTYPLELRTGADGVLTAAVWQRGNPTVRADRVLGLAASDWVTGSGRMYTFSAYATSGVLSLDRVEESGQRTKMANGKRQLQEGSAHYPAYEAEWTR